jgi:hypothetical protein
LTVRHPLLPRIRCVLGSHGSGNLTTAAAPQTRSSRGHHAGTAIVSGDLTTAATSAAADFSWTCGGAASRRRPWMYFHRGHRLAHHRRRHSGWTPSAFRDLLVEEVARAATASPAGATASAAGAATSSADGAATGSSAPGAATGSADGAATGSSAPGAATGSSAPGAAAVFPAGAAAATAAGAATTSNTAVATTTGIASHIEVNLFLRCSYD